MKERIKNTKGITLIALIITIIILLILAGVTINVAIGDNGLFSKSKEVVNRYKSAEENETAIIDDLLNNWNNIISGGTLPEEPETEVTSISLSPTTLTVNIGETSLDAIQVTYTPTNAEGRTVTWTSDNAAIATVSSDGKITGVAVGTTTITATTPNGKTATCSVTVTDPDATTKRVGDITITPKYDYGKVVTGYNSKTSGITWRLWYVDNPSTTDKSQDTVYLIGDFITTAQAPTKTVSGTTYTVNGGENDKCSYFTNILPAYTNSSKWVWDNQQAIASKWLSQWYAYGSHKTTGDNNNMKTTAYMMDSGIWTIKFGDTAGTQANYVLGGPTIEMFCASYKDSHPKKYLESRVNVDVGYDVAWNENGTVGAYNSYQTGVDTTGNNKIYAPGSSSYPQAMWLASPTSRLNTNVVGVDSSGSINDYYYTHSRLGFCPVVSLKSGVQIEASGDGFRIK